MANRKYIYYSEVDRFGYTLRCIALTEKECREAMISEYVRAYEQRNGENPKEVYEQLVANEEFIDDNYAAEDYARFIGELEIEKRELNKVEWD